MAAAMQLFVAAVLAAVLLFHYSDAGPPLMVPPGHSNNNRSNPFKSHCGITEQSSLFNRCLQSFGFRQLSALFAMSRANRCLVDRLDCDVANQTVTCINNLLWPKAPIRSSFTFSISCKDGIKETLSYLLTEHRFNCGYHDVECRCWRVIPDISAAAAKGQPRTIPPPGC